MGAELVGNSLEPVRGILRELVRTPVRFLLVGPTGAGKDEFARAFHRASSRADRTFHVVDCAAIPESLFESALFGHRRGAFTGADGDRVGILEAAKGGFVLLNEITDVPLATQAKLRQAIDEKLIWRVGDSSPTKIDVWIAAATNRTDMLRMCDKGQFRKDLYFRLARVVVQIPALRDRAADIPELVNHFVRRAATGLGRRPISIGVDAEGALKSYGWPGNVRELENLIHSLTVAHEGSAIGIEMIPKSMRHASGRRARVTRDLLRRNLVQEDWNVSRASGLMGLSRQRVHALMRLYKVARPARNHAQANGSQPNTLGV